MLLNLILHDVSNRFNWVQIRWVWRPKNDVYTPFQKLFAGAFGCMTRSIVLHEPKLRIQSHPAVYNGYNMLRIGLLIDYAPVLFPKWTGPFSGAWKGALKHSSTLSRNTRYNTDRIVLFVSSSSDPYFAMTRAVDPGFIAPQYSFSLFLDSVYMLVCPG